MFPFNLEGGNDFHIGLCDSRTQGCWVRGDLKDDIPRFHGILNPLEVEIRQESNSCKKSWMKTTVFILCGLISPRWIVYFERWFTVSAASWVLCVLSHVF